MLHLNSFSSLFQRSLFSLRVSLSTVLQGSASLPTTPDSARGASPAIHLSFTDAHRVKLELPPNNASLSEESEPSLRRASSTCQAETYATYVQAEKRP